MTRVPNPKQPRGSHRLHANWYPYYAGFSKEFVLHMLERRSGAGDACVLDPWNGSGTTTYAAKQLGVRALGFDLNPAMTVVARSRLLGYEVKESLQSLGTDIVKAGRRMTPVEGDPLEIWMTPASAAVVRAVERAAHRILVNEDSPADRLPDGAEVDDWSALAAFYYVALFKTTRWLLRRFRSANPSWLRTPETLSSRIRPTYETVSTAFLSQVEQLSAALLLHPHPLDPGDEARVDIQTGDARALPLKDHTVDVVISSPPYCTRLDYAVATRPELAILGFSESAFRALRERLVGTTAIAKGELEVNPRWGKACLRFLKRVGSHDSKGSRSYYWKNHSQYFDGIFQSMTELARVLARPGECALVVQDSHYKNLHTDLPLIVTEMAAGLGWRLQRRHNFKARQSLLQIHAASPHRSTPAQASEAVLEFKLAS